MTRFAASMERLGPFEAAPAVAIAASGGADSMALAVLAKDWTRRRSGTCLALVVDHGLRCASGNDAAMTIATLHRLGISARLLRLANLSHGPALAERARIGRYEVLIRACREAGILHLLLGHHAADQVETVVMRVLRGSQTHGLAGMAAVRETADVRLLRPLLAVEPARLRQFLTTIGIDWIEDPSNQDKRAMRGRVRSRLAMNASVETGLQQAISAVGALRSRTENDVAEELASRVSIRPEGFALLSAGRIGAAALSSLIQTIGGTPYPASPAQLSDLAAEPKPTMLAGVRIMPAGRLSDLSNGLLIVREEQAVMAPVEASPDTTWDRFRLILHPHFPKGAMIGKLGSDAVQFRKHSMLPSAVLRTLPAVRVGKVLAAVPHLGYASNQDVKTVMVLFSPRKSLGGPDFFPIS